MTNPPRHNLNLIVNDTAALKQLEISSEIDISVDFGVLTSISHLDRSVLVISFDNGEIRLDLSDEDFFNTEPLCTVLQHKIQIKETRGNDHE